MVIRAVVVARVAATLAIAAGAGCKQRPSDPPSAAAAAPARSGASVASDPCASICERTRPLNCRREASCQDDCQEMARVEACRTEMAATLGCFATQPLTAWACDDDGQAALKDGFCTPEQSRFAGCLQRATTHPARPRAP
jgi:hypothetical protein